MRIGFLFNHDQIHQVAHSLPIAMAMARSFPSVEIVVATTCPALRNEVERILGAEADRPAIQHIGLTPKATAMSRVVKALNGVIPAAKLAIYRDNLEFFRSLDALVVAEKTSALLKTRYGLDGLKLIHTRHGAGDRAIGFNRNSATFDFVLVSGPKIRDRLAAEAGIPLGQMAVVGYPKFDLPRSSGAPQELIDNGRPIVLYNPHVSPHLSSWYKHGKAVLDYFVDNPEYNLIFAPHVMLFQRKVAVSIDKLRIAWPGKIDNIYWNAPNIHIDLGSVASTDMSYTEAADIYLGDVSSQIYEFMLRPRPCVFLNSHHHYHRSDPNYLHWTAGPVITHPSGLNTALMAAQSGADHYLSVQRELFERSIELLPTPSSTRAANAIAQFLGIAATIDFPDLVPASVNEAVEEAA